VRGGTLNAKTARLVERQATAMKAARLSVCALVVHHDVDRSSHGHRIKAVRAGSRTTVSANMVWLSWSARPTLVWNDGCAWPRESTGASEGPSPVPEASPGRWRGIRAKASHSTACVLPRNVPVRRCAGNRTSTRSWLSGARLSAHSCPRIGCQPDEHPGRSPALGGEEQRYRGGEGKQPHHDASEITTGISRNGWP